MKIKVRGNHRGTSLVEYGILAGLISAVAIPLIFTMGGTVESTFSEASTDLADANVEAQPEVPTPPSCYEPEFLGTVGEPHWPDCAGMYIIGTAEFQSITNNGGGTFQVLGPDTNVYTVADGGRNIFTGQVTDFSSAFRGYNGSGDFNGEIAYLDTSNVTDFSAAFIGNSLFSRPIDIWDTSNAVDMSAMFQASAFDGDISGWDTSRVVNMTQIFAEGVFNRDIAGWNTPLLETLVRFAYGNNFFNQDISGWDTSSVTDCFEFDRGAPAWLGANKPPAC